jgi:hypothetical protein
MIKFDFSSSCFDELVIFHDEDSFATKLLDSKKITVTDKSIIVIIIDEES